MAAKKKSRPKKGKKKSAAKKKKAPARKKAAKRSKKKAPARKKAAKKSAAKPAKKKRKKGRRTVMRSSAGKKLYAVRAADGTFKDIQTYERAHRADLARTGTSNDAGSGGGNDLPPS
jgi:hypothetical protein